MKPSENRVLVLAKHGSDAAVTCKLLGREHLACDVCADLDDLAAQIAAGAGCAIVSIESIAGERRQLIQTVDAQPPWSDFPFIVLTAGPLPARVSLDWLGKVMMLDRPLTVHSLVTTVQTALRARARQYEARTAIEQRDQFLAMLGHELRNPLGAILLASEVEAGDPQRRLEIVARQARHLTRLVDDLLEVSRVTAGKVALQRARVDLVALVTSAVDSLRPLAKAREVAIAIEANGPVLADGDPLRLAQIVDNLLTNAIKYSRKGGHVVVEATLETARCVLRVRDDGIGIAPDMLPRIFELFTQVDGTLDRADGGMGIGLTLVRRLVDLHGGLVEVASDGLGKGSLFTVTLPRWQVEPAPSAAVVAPVPEPAATALRVVLVDDNEDLRDLSAALLEQMGCAVVTAADGRAGLAEILRSRPQLALIDIGLPLLNGFDVASAVRTELGKTPFLVAVTGYGQAQDVERSRSAGFDRHLTKPVNASRFSEIIAAARLHATG